MGKSVWVIPSPSSYGEQYRETGQHCCYSAWVASLPLTPWFMLASRSQLPWITERKDLRYLLSVVKRIVVASGLRTKLSLTSFRQGGLTEGADSGLTDAELRAAARHRSTR